jgi:hypothetical protein
MNWYHQKFMKESEGMSPEALKELVSTYYGKGRFVDSRSGIVYIQGFLYLRDPGNVRFYCDGPPFFGIFTFDELENLTD